MRALYAASSSSYACILALRTRGQACKTQLALVSIMLYEMTFKPRMGIQRKLRTGSWSLAAVTTRAEATKETQTGPNGSGRGQKSFFLT